MSRKRTSGAFRVALGAAISTERKRLGWSQEVLAEHADLGRSYVTELEGGNRTPNLDTLLRVAEALGMKTSKLIALGEAQLAKAS